MKIYIGADHRGFSLKEKVKNWLLDWKYDFEDLGAYELNRGDDYTIFAEKVAQLVAKQENTRGILLCGSGVGVNIIANKFDGIRASIGKNAEQVKAGRNDDDMNVLAIAADYTKEDGAKEMVKVFLKTKFAAKKRYKKRLEDMRKLERRN